VVFGVIAGTGVGGGIVVDGKVLKSVSVPSQISAVNQQGGSTQRSSQEIKVFLTGGEHVFEARFDNDEGLKDIPKSDRFNNGKNIYPDSIEIAGPFPSSEPHPSQKKVLICDPASGAECVSRILTGLARKGYRRSATKDEVAALRGRKEMAMERQKLFGAVVAFQLVPPLAE
jgi:hypothetical protein